MGVGVGVEEAAGVVTVVDAVGEDVSTASEDDVHPESATLPRVSNDATCSTRRRSSMHGLYRTHPSADQSNPNDGLPEQHAAPSVRITDARAEALGTFAVPHPTTPGVPCGIQPDGVEG